ncbi:MAG TPA: hypothetical protein VEK15_30985 [Vicinamibacteria bacterium]|nr:hypothetical protein [Vicinamibacteria bacterium]
MHIESGSIWLDLAPELAEEVLRLAADSASEQERRAYVEEREAISGIEIVDIREDAFRSFDARWIDRFGILETIRTSISEEMPVAGCSLQRVRTQEEERSFIDSVRGQRVLMIHAMVPTLLSRPALRTLLRRVE